MTAYSCALFFSMYTNIYEKSIQLEWWLVSVGIMILKNKLRSGICEKIERDGGIWVPLLETLFIVQSVQLSIPHASAWSFDHSIKLRSCFKFVGYVKIKLPETKTSCITAAINAYCTRTRNQLKVFIYNINTWFINDLLRENAQC